MWSRRTDATGWERPSASAPPGAPPRPDVRTQRLLTPTDSSPVLAVRGAVEVIAMVRLRPAAG